MNVADVMTPRSEVVTAELPGTREDVLAHFQEQSFSSVPVVKVEDGVEAFRGLVSRDDLIERPDEDQLALLMREVPTTTRETTIEDLAELMREKGTRRVPVVDGQLEGIVTITDVIRAVADGEVDVDATAGSVASRDVNTTYCKTPLPVVERELFFANVPYAVVLDDEGDMDGIVTAVDVIAVAEVVEGEDDTGESLAGQDDDWMWEGFKAVGNRYLPTRNVEFPDDPVEAYMSEDVITVSQRKPIADVARLMIGNDIEQVPLVSGDELVGIVRDVDVLEAVG